MNKKIVTGSKVGILDSKGHMNTHYVTKTCIQQGHSLSIVYFDSTDDYESNWEYENSCILLKEQPFKFFYTDIRDRSGRCTVAYKIRPDGVYFSYAKCKPDVCKRGYLVEKGDRFTKQAGRYYAMNAKETHFISMQDLQERAESYSSEDAYRNNRLTNFVILNCIEDYLDDKEN